ncbi:MAG: hypothetical protein KDA96_26220 [Planctomycetaceae bacterium]|nr:hypothetical protein [Planctomycetaceae bacterium]MCA9066601.1 hypothetical protein [Planctomycetaceae bacterium]
MATIRFLRQSSRLHGALLILVVSGILPTAALSEESAGEGRQLPALSGDTVTVNGNGRTVWLHPTDAGLQQKQMVIPRLCAPIRSIRWTSESDAEIRFTPELTTWAFSWQEAPANPVIQVMLDGDPVLLQDQSVVTPDGDGSVMLHAHQATTTGEKLRFEPQWYKNTVGYWTVASDYASWKFAVDQPGTFSVALLQGCGKGQGGSDGVVSLFQGDDCKAEVSFQALETGHFQNFRWNHLGHVTIAQAGQYELRITPRKIARNAMFDVRMVHLVRQAQPAE